MAVHRVIVVRWFVDRIPDQKYGTADYKRWTIIGKDEQDEEQCGYTFNPWCASLCDQSKRLGEWLDWETQETRFGWKLVKVTFVPFSQKPYVQEATP